MTDDQALAFARERFALCSIQYRRIGNAHGVYSISAPGHQTLYAFTVARACQLSDAPRGAITAACRMAREGSVATFQCEGIRDTERHPND